MLLFFVTFVFIVLYFLLPAKVTSEIVCTSASIVFIEIQFNDLNTGHIVNQPIAKSFIVLRLPLRFTFSLRFLLHSAPIRPDHLIMFLIGVPV